MRYSYFMNEIEGMLSCGLCSVMSIWVIVFGVMYMALIIMTGILFLSSRCEASRIIFAIVVVFHILVMVFAFSYAIGPMLLFGVISALFAIGFLLGWIISLFDKYAKPERQFEFLYLAIGTAPVAFINMAEAAPMVSSI